MLRVLPIDAANIGPLIVNPALFLNSVVVAARTVPAI